MTTVYCYLKECLKRDPEKCSCLAQEISLDEEHSCCGGCDEGWVFAENEEEDE